MEGDRQVTYAELDERSNRLAHHFRSLGLQQQDRVAILAGNCTEYFEVELAAAKAGVIVAALNGRLADRELQHCVSLVEPKLVLASAAFQDNLERLDLGAASTLPFGPEYEQSLSSAASHDPDLDIDPEAGLIILYTSGTTGLPKGALISHRAMIARGMMFAADFQIPEDDHYIVWTPLYHMVATDQGLAHLLRGNTLHLVDGFLPDKIIPIIEAHEMHWLTLVPGMVGLFVAELKERGVKPKGVSYIGAMADLVPRPEIAAATTFFDAPFVNSFGATETGICPASNNQIEVGEAPQRLPKRQNAYCDVRLVDREDNEVPVGTPGEVSITGPTLFSGYWNNDKANAADFRGGRFHIGDVLVRNADGTLEYVDRVKYMIKSGGENIYPAEIESILNADERVATAVVVRKADDRWGEVPVLFLVAREKSLTEGQVLELCERELSRYKRPKAVYFIQDEELPRSTTGKIQRHVLEDRVASMESRR
jgi:fatty-acyl-CoA synthase